MSLPRCVLVGTTYLVTRRCLGRRFLLRPEPALNDVFLYCLGVAANKHGVQVHAVCVMSNHYHLVMTDVRGALPDFMRALNRSIAMSVKRLHSWDEVLWEPNVPYSAVELAGPEEILDKIAYTLLNPVSAGLVRSPERWPGLVSTLARIRKGSLQAARPRLWFRNSAPKDAAVHFTLPPGFVHKADYLHALEALLASRRAELHREHRRLGRGYLGRVRVRKTRVTDHPKTKKRRFGRNPTFSALTRAMWLEAMRQLRGFRRAYRAAYRAWREGDRDATFPLGTWWVVRFAGAATVT